MKNTPRVLIALITMPDNVRLQQEAAGVEGGFNTCAPQRAFHGAALLINAHQPQGPNAEIGEL